MTIHVTNCSSGQPIYLATVADIYGNSQYTDQYGNVQVPPGNDANLFGTLVRISAYTFITAEFTITSHDVNNFCLSPAPSTGGGTGGTSGGIY